MPSTGTIVLAGKNFFDKKLSLKLKKRFITQSKHMIFLKNKTFLKADVLLLLFLQKNCFFHFGRGP